MSTAENKNSMSVWVHAEQVDAECTKEDTSGGYKATTINGYWFIKKATELWGPCGAGWGYDILEDRFDEAAIIKDDSTDVPLCKSTMHTIKLQLWYTQSGEKHTIIQYGHTPYIYQTKYGPRTDMEAPKKSLMDAIKKCLSMLGFASDVYLGEWDDPAYAALRHAESEIEGADNKEERLQEEIDKITVRATDSLKTMGESIKISELDRIYKSSVRYLEGLKKSKSAGIRDEATRQLSRVARGYEKRTNQLKEQQSETV